MSTKRRNVLIIEDETEISEVLSIALEIQGHDVRNSRTRDEALVLIESTAWRPDIILLDYSMAGMAAEEFVHRLAHSFVSQLPRLVLMTAANEAERRAAKLGIPEILKKPFDPTHVFNSIETCVS